MCLCMPSLSHHDDLTNIAQHSGRREGGQARGRHERNAVCSRAASTQYTWFCRADGDNRRNQDYLYSNLLPACYSIHTFYNIKYRLLRHIYYRPNLLPFLLWFYHNMQQFLPLRRFGSMVRRTVYLPFYYLLTILCQFTVFLRRLHWAAFDA